MKTIFLTQNCITTVDDEDFQRLMQFKWNLLTGSVGYKKYAFNRKAGLMHRFIMAVPDGMEIDHIDGDGLNNCKTNLRVCTRSQNNMHKAKYSRGVKTKSRYKGVDFYEKYGNWRARISKGDNTYHLGYFDDEDTAAQAYDIVATELHGEFAKVNFRNESP